MSQTKTPSGPKAETLKIEKTVAGSASLLDAEVKKGLDVTVVAASEGCRKLQYCDRFFVSLVFFSWSFDFVSL